MNNELVVLSPDEIIESGLSGFNEKDLPVMIQGQISKLKELDKSVKKAMKAANVAKDSANSARSKSAGFGKKKVAIEELQSAGIDLAEAVQSGAEAQKISFEFQTKLAEISKYLFGLGVSNIASNRFVVRELEMKLKGASKEELSELARQELISVVKQLKEQEDILRKQENFSKIIKIHDERLKVQFQKSQQIDEQLQAHAEIDKRHSEQLKIHAEASKRLEEQLKTQAELGRLHSEQLEAHAENDKVHDEQLKIQAEIDKKLEEKLQAHAEIGKKLKNQLESQAEFDKLHDERLKILVENIEKHDEQLVNLHEKNNDLNDKIKNNLKAIEAQEIKIKMLNDEIHNLKILLDSKGNKTLSKITLAVAIIAFVASVINYLFY
ncbi:MULTISPECIES: hypothetical protein [Bacillus]|uniref:hypothetical protein n=1 Tax=Bacillus TaxID=1386 RepID=UPI0029C5F257|nr:hypothetical protein [Bacillus paranthracis]MDX6047613.1 hypothetical protein [Bacillus paranthracis]